MGREDSLDARVLVVSAENALFPGYNGGLGVLVADWMKSCADMGIPAGGITMYYPEGFFRQELDTSGWQTGDFSDPPKYPEGQPWNPCDMGMQHFGGKHGVKAPLGGVKREIGGYVYALQPSEGTTHGAPIPILLVDAQLGPDARLYNDTKKSSEYVALSMGLKIFESIFGAKERVIHLNDSHGALTALTLLEERLAATNDIGKALAQAREITRYSTHTIVDAARFELPIGTIETLRGSSIDPRIIQALGIGKSLDFDWFARTMSRPVNGINGVSALHTDITRLIYPTLPQEQVFNATNGVHHLTWTPKPFMELYDQKLPGWRDDPSLMFNAPSAISPEEIWDAHGATKAALLQFINYDYKRRDLVSGEGNFEVDALTIGFARRFATYKRSDLLFYEMDRIAGIADKFFELYHKPLQIVYAGKAHPDDYPGKLVLQSVIKYGRQLSSEHHVRFAFIEDYNVDVAKVLDTGVDVWLNTPQRPNEASGTSGMKAAMAGVLNFSSQDGWWPEGYRMSSKYADELGWKGLAAGWNIGGEPIHVALKSISEDMKKEDADSLYTTLENSILPEYYGDRDSWTKRMLLASSLGGYFNTNRCVADYATLSWGLGDVPAVQSMYQRAEEMRQKYIL